MKRQVDRHMSEHDRNQLEHMKAELRRISSDTCVKGGVAMDLFNAIDSLNSALVDDQDKSMD